MKYLKPEMDIVEFDGAVLTGMMNSPSGDVDNLGVEYEDGTTSAN